MEDSSQSRLINQAQFRRLGNHFDNYYVNRDVKYLNNAIKILQDKLDYINENYIPRATSELQSKLGMTDSEYREWLVRVTNTPKEKLVNLGDSGESPAHQKEDDTDKDNRKENDSTDSKGSAHDEAQEEASPSNDDNNDHEERSKSNDDDSHDDHPQESKSDLDFLNNMNN